MESFRLKVFRVAAEELSFTHAAEKLFLTQPAVTMQILPFDAGSHPAMGGPFTILRFSEPDLRDVVYIEQLTSAIYLDKPTDVDSYLEVMEQLCLQAEPAAETQRMLSKILKDL